MTNVFESLTTALADRYTIEREIGAGGMATVYLAHDLKHDRKVAIKVLRPELAAVLGAERFLNEIKITANLQHPHILPLFDSGRAVGRYGGTAVQAPDSFLYYVMPFVDGESLREKLNREKQLSIEESVEVTKAVASALDYAHRHNVVHRDIKPENILLHDGQPLVADFGIALAIAAAGGERVTETGLALGTPHYMSPEQAAGDRDADARSDVYALGCVVYEMLAGEPPFMGKSAASLMAKHAAEPPPSAKSIRATVPDAIDACLKKALAKAPADRFESARAFADALTAIEADRHTPSAASKRARVIVMSVAVAIVLVLAALWLNNGQGDGSTTLDPRRIAVLYFDDLSPEGDAAYLASGLTEGLIHELSQVEELEVISRNGVKPYRETDSSVAHIAQDLQVGTFVEGSVQRVGDTVRVTVQLIDALSLRHLASRTVNRPWGDWLGLQDDVSQEVAWFLRGRLGREIVLRERRSRTTSDAAWELVQRATRVLDGTPWGSGDPRAETGRLEQVDGWLREAAEQDRYWPEPLLLRGRVALLGASEPWAVVDSALLRRLDSIVEIVVDFADQAVALEPGAAPLALRGNAFARRAWVENDPEARASWFDLAEDDFRAAVRMDGDHAEAWADLSRVLQAQGRGAEANVAARQALEADPFLQSAASLLEQLFWTSLDLGEDTEALEWCTRGRTRFGDHSWTVDCVLALMVVSEAIPPDFDEAQHLTNGFFERFESLPREPRAALEEKWETTLAAILARSGMTDSAKTMLRGVWRRWGADSGLRMTMQDLYMALAVEDPILLSLIESEDLYSSMDTVFMMGDFWGRALLRDSVLRRRARILMP